MWATLRSDLSEFVSTVAEESTNALNALDSKLEGDDDGRTPRNQNNNAAWGEDGDVMTMYNSGDDTGVVRTPSDEVDRRRSSEETYTEPLDDDDDQDADADVAAFLASYDVASQTDVIAACLEQHEDLKEFFEGLVPTRVSYVDFWTRYFYRCDLDRVERQWEEEEERQQRQQQSFAGGLSSMFGNAVAAVQQQNPGVHLNREGYEEAANKGPLGMAGLLLGQRLNTAVDDTFSENDDDDEEELGWDSEEDDDYEEEDDRSEQIDFSPSTEDVADTKLNEEQQRQLGEERYALQQTFADENYKLREQQRQLEEERDSLQRTVAGQADEIDKLRRQVGILSTSDKDEENEEDGKKKLKMLLFEKDLEIANLKASVQDLHQEDHDEKDHQLQTAKDDLSAKDQELTSLKSRLDAALADARQAQEELSAAQRTFREQEVVFAKTLEEERARLVASSPATTTEEKIGDGILNQTDSFSSGEKVGPATASSSSIITAHDQPTTADEDVDVEDDDEEEDGWGSDGWGDDD